MRLSVFGPMLLLVTMAGPSLAEETGTEQSPAKVTISGPATVTIWNVTDKKQIADVQRSFQTELARVGVSGQIVHCEHVVAVSHVEEAGRVTAGRGLSYGALCSVQSEGRRLRLLMCDFPMVGKFTVTGSGVLSLEWFANFIRTNCPAGG